jgi:hypothetical protein
MKLGLLCVGLLFLAAGIAQGDICQHLPDGTVTCLEDPGLMPLITPSDTEEQKATPASAKSGHISITFSGSPGVTFSDDMSYSGQGVVEQAYQGTDVSLNSEKIELDRLLFGLWGQLDQVEDVAFFLASHSYNVSAAGQVTLTDGSRWQIVCNNNIIRSEAIA